MITSCKTNLELWSQIESYKRRSLYLQKRSIVRRMLLIQFYIKMYNQVWHTRVSVGTRTM